MIPIVSSTFKECDEEPKPCPCCQEGQIEPSWNANVGQCNECKKKFSWDELK